MYEQDQCQPLVGYTRFETGISENNLRSWGPLHVLKEFLQNAVYAKTILGNDITIEWKDGYAYISNTPSGFSKGKLLIGESEQADVKGAPGQYGEGMKVAMAVACRCKMACKVHTNGFTVSPSLEPSSLDKDVRVLVFHINDNDYNDGTQFVIECEKEVLEKAKTYFAVLQGLEVEKTKMDTILPDFKGVFANGVKITDTPALYGYNFTNAELINRDRSTVDMNKLKQHVNRTLCSIEDEEILTEVIKNVVQDDTLLEAQAGMDFSIADKSVWQSIKEKVFGKKVVMATGDASDTAARYKKFSVLTNVPKSWKWFFESKMSILPSNRVDELMDKPKNIHKKASANENQTLGWAKRLVGMYYGDYGTVRVSETVYDSHGNERAGIYEKSTDTIWLKRSVLSSKEMTFKVLLHETIHRITGADDNTEAFTRGWEDACWGILNKGRK